MIILNKICWLDVNKGGTPCLEFLIPLNKSVCMCINVCLENSMEFADISKNPNPKLDTASIFEEDLKYYRAKTLVPVEDELAEAFVKKFKKKYPSKTKYIKILEASLEKELTWRKRR